jgi:hypothetical protein
MVMASLAGGQRVAACESGDRALMRIAMDLGGMTHCGDDTRGCLFDWQARFPIRTVAVPGLVIRPLKAGPVFSGLGVDLVPVMHTMQHKDPYI